ncbi:LacI family DNA-binding transcriptional regulator [Jatrophihabitans sp. YIM 134969]
MTAHTGDQDDQGHAGVVALPSSRRPALLDVAARAGVSHQTVSRVLNDSPHVAPATREKVRRAIDELGYRRNMSARALATGKSNVIGVVAPSSTLYGPAAIVAGLSHAARAAAMTFTVEDLTDHDTNSLHDAVDRLLGHGIAGLLMVLPLDAATEIVSSVVPEGIPVVTVDRPLSDDVATVSVDQYAGAVLATRHLLEQGHATVWHVAGPDDWNDSRAREAGWRDTLAAAGVEEPPVVRGDWSPASGYQAGRLLARVPECTAVFAANDHMALGFARALHEAGRSIPGDVGLVGFDGVPESEYFTPPLTTVVQDFGAVGRAGVELLVEQINGATSRRSVLIAPVLVERASTRRG